jgi:iron-sulfur cluster repair protein YtfE (RIC family)
LEIKELTRVTSEFDASSQVASSPSVTEYLTSDHRRLDEVLFAFEGLVSAGAFRDAQRRFAEFASGLGRHIDAEEEILFPAFDQMTGTVGVGPTFVMRSEHVKIRLLMNQVAHALAAADAAAMEASLQELKQLLANHNMKEERILYPTMDQAAGSDRARHNLVTRLRTGG